LPLSIYVKTPVYNKSVNVNNKGKNLKRIRITVCGGVCAASDGLYGFA